ncbi:MAG: PIN domain-containing protein [Deltaproteobacteria bacterium]|nr:PIN domain-containing protein [Deltaproteobacteria bacterium]
MIVADTGGILALLNGQDEHHGAVRDLYERDGAWILPWAILPEVDYLAGQRMGDQVARAFVADLKDGLFTVDAGVAKDLPRATELLARYADQKLGLVDAVVMAQAERHHARVIVTTDARHFRAVKLRISPPPRLVPIDG